MANEIPTETPQVREGGSYLQDKRGKVQKVEGTLPNLNPGGKTDEQIRAEEGAAPAPIEASASPSALEVKE